MSIKDFFYTRERIARRYALAMKGESAKLYYPPERQLLMVMLYSETGAETDLVTRRSRRWILYSALNKAAFRGHALGQELVLDHPNTAAHWAATSRRPPKGSQLESQLLMEVDKGVRAWSSGPWSREGAWRRSLRTRNANDFIEPTVISSRAEEKLQRRLDEQLPVAKIRTWLFSAPHRFWVPSAMTKAYIRSRFFPHLHKGQEYFSGVNPEWFHEIWPAGG